MQGDSESIVAAMPPPAGLSVSWAVETLSPMPLPAVWVVDLDYLFDLPVSTDAERELAGYYGEVLWAHRFLFRRAAIRRITSGITGQNPDSVGLIRGPTGALKFDPPIPGLNVSLSHRGHYAAMAFGNTPVGVDLESLSDFVQIPWNVLHPLEVEALGRLDEDQRPLAFLRLWTVKEAYVKALGFGLAREPSSFSVRLDGPEAVIDDPLTQDRPPLVSTRIISSLGPDLIVVSCVTFPGG